MATSRDWQCDKSLTECLEHMLKSNIATDVTFLVGEERKVVHAHKFILMSRSPVFEAMLDGPMSEKGDITVPDIEENIFKLFLGYLYTDKIQLDIHNALRVLAAARKYCVDILLMQCERFIEENTNLTNAGVLLEEAHIFMDEESKFKCLKLIWDNPEEFLESEHFGQLCSDCVNSIMDSDYLTVEEEEHVYEAVLRWSEEECARQGLEVTDENRRIVLGDILYTVRFPLLKLEYFTEVVSITDILTTEDIASVLRLKSGKGKIFNQNMIAKKRLENKKSQRVMRFDQTRYGNFDSNGFQYVLSFQATKNVTFHGICLYKTKGQFRLHLELYSYNDFVTLLHRTQITVTPQGFVTDVTLNETVSLISSKKYKLVMRGETTFLCYGSTGMRSVNIKSTKIDFLPTGNTCNFYLSQADCIDEGPIAGLLLSGL